MTVVTVEMLSTGAVNELPSKHGHSFAICGFSKGRTISKVMGGAGKQPKTIHARENTKKKKSCKEEGKEKNLADGRSNCVFYLTYKICQCL